MINLVSFDFEEQLWNQGFDLIAGADEVGRGSFAGPVIAAAVIFPQSNPALKAEIEKARGEGILINDSKKLTAKQREISAIWVKEQSLAWGIGQSSVKEIDRLGIVKATQKAFRKAIFSANQALQSRVDFLLIDAFYLPYLQGLRRCSQMAIKKGDSLCFSIASASILAKVHRDQLMKKLGRKREIFQKYAWEKNKGYGTKHHREMILQHGITRHHRQSFVSSFLEKIKTG